MVTTTTIIIVIITFVAGDEQYSNEARSLLVYVCIVYIYIYMPMYIITATITYHVNIKHIIIKRNVFYSVN